MPYTPEQVKAFRARAHGADLKKKSLMSISPSKAEGMLKEAGQWTEREKFGEGAKRALKRMKS